MEINTLEGPDLVRWTIRAVLECEGRPVGLSKLEAQPVDFPFALGENLGFFLPSAPDLDLRADSAGSQLVSIRD